MLSCREITELVTSYVEGRLPLADRLRFMMHLAMCTGCRRYVRQLETTATVLGRVEVAPPDAQQLAALLHQFRTWN